MSVLVLGLNPSKKLSKSGSMKVLKNWLTELELQYVSFDNIYPHYGQFSLKDVQHEYLREICNAPSKIISLGAKTHYILSIMGINHFSLPHPSGLNRQLNNLGFIQSKLDECKKYLRES